MGDHEPKISDATRAGDRKDAQTKGHADRMPTDDEQAAAEQQTLDPGVASAYENANERGATQRGEGRIEG